MSSKSRKKHPDRRTSLNKAVSNALVIFIWAFVSEFSPDEAMVERVKHQVESVRDSVIKGALTVPQIRKALLEDYGWEVT